MSRNIKVELYVPLETVTIDRLHGLFATLFAAGFSCEYGSGYGVNYWSGFELYEHRTWAAALAALEQARGWAVTLWTPTGSLDARRDVFLQIWSTGTTEPGQLGLITLSTSFSRRREVEPLLPEQFLGWALLLAHLTQPVYGWGGSDEGLLGRDKLPIVAATVVSLQPLPIEWLTIYGPTYVERMGRERILATPAWRADFLTAGGLAVTLAPHPDDVPEEEARRAAAHLGIPGPRTNPHLQGRGEAFPALRQLFAAYFNEDWDLDYPSWMEAVDDYVQGEGSDAAADATDDLDRLLAIDLAADDLQEAVFKGLGCYYYPPGEGLSMRAWLELVRGRLAQGNW